MKLIIQIPCLNEADHLPAALGDLPRELPGVDVVEWLVIDDGSTDATLAVARQAGVHHVVRFVGHRGLAAAYLAGIDHALRVGADIIVGTDADNQYDAADIRCLIAPILAGTADVVVGDRSPGRLMHFSWTKRRLQTVGSWVMRRVSGVAVADATSGFRALSREAASRLRLTTQFSYTLEMLIQLGQEGLVFANVPVGVRATTRPSRLSRSTLSYVCQSALSVCRAYTFYFPFRVFAAVGGGLLGLGAALALGLAARPVHAGPLDDLPGFAITTALVLAGWQAVLLGAVAELAARHRRAAPAPN